MTSRDVKFVLEIPYVDPKKVDVEAPDSKYPINFKSLKKGASFDSGTRVELWYEFMTPGRYTPSYLTVRINNWPYRIQFSPVEIEEDPAAQKPRLIIKFSNGENVSSNVRNYKNSIFSMPATETIKFTVYLQYAIQVLNFDYDIPKNALLENTNLHEITEVKYREKKYSHDLFPVADFEWTPLLPGTVRIPEIRMKAIAYDGTRQDISSPYCFIDVKNLIKDSQENETQTDTDDAFYIDDLVDEIVLAETTPEDIFLKIKERRKKIIISIFIFIGITILVAIIFLLCKVNAAHPYVIISAVLLLLLVLFVNTYKKKSAIYTGGVVYSIPEDQAENHFQLISFSEVKILKETNDWLCIQSGENIGWTKKGNIIYY